MEGMTTFEDLWAEASDPSDRDNDERRDLAEHFFERAATATVARIRQMALDEASRRECLAADGYDELDTPSEVLHAFAALLEKP